MIIIAIARHGEDGSASKLIANYSRPAAYDLMGFQDRDFIDVYICIYVCIYIYIYMRKAACGAPSFGIFYVEKVCFA